MVMAYVLFKNKILNNFVYRDMPLLDIYITDASVDVSDCTLFPDVARQKNGFDAYR